MIKQYLAIKGDYPDAILFYRMGDFYEMFFEDAETASRVLEITLTSRNKNDESPVPMCGVPHRAAATYIARLIENGYKVAVCDQVEDPATAKGLVKREVVRVITPGMIIDAEFLDARANNFILAVARAGGMSGLAYLDISTGTFRVTEAADPEAVLEEARRVAPKEILLPESARNDPSQAWTGRLFGDVALTHVEDKAFDYRRGYERLTAQFQTLTLEGFGGEHFKAGVERRRRAHVLRRRDPEAEDRPHHPARKLLARELPGGGRDQPTQPGADPQHPHRLPPGDAARLCSTRPAPPWAHGFSRAGCAARCGSARRSSAAWPPWRKARTRCSCAGELREQLKAVHDIERVGSKTVMNQANARDLVALKQSLVMLPVIWERLAELSAELFRPAETVDDLSGLAGLIERSMREDAPPTVNEGHLIKPGFNAELDELVRISRDAKGYLAQLERTERELTGINTLRVSYNKVFGYYIEVPKARAASVPGHYVRKQTLVNAERYITDELKTFESRVLGAEEQRAALEHRLFQEVCAEAARHHPKIQAVARFLAQLDCLLSLAEVADQNDYCRPEILADGRIHIEEGRHPVVEKMISGERFVPNTIVMDDTENQVLVITGPNMAGKSTVLRQVALLVIMAQMGSFVPARRAAIGVVDRIFTRVGALDNLSQGQSTFMVEMQETANILNNATEKSLVILDEIGRGTSTFDGLSIAWAVAEHLHDLNQKGVKTLFATHYHELTDLADQKPRVQNFNIAVKEWNDEIIFLRKLVPGGTNRSYGIQVARLAGIPPAVIRRAKKILYGIESGEHGAPVTVAAGRGASPGPVQLDLFRKSETQVLARLRTVDLDKLTPLEAMNLLNLLQEMAGGRAG